ncbi:MAG: PEP-CTERM sorting domain-containing protein [Methylococcaceae bacterium]|nr:PEP-CTERM sorting domain-containing protein [Methylococcaceae bacterium]
MIKKILLTLAVLTSNACLTANATPSLSFSLSSQTVALGGQASVDVVLNGLETDGLDQILSAYDLSITWDDSILNLSTYSGFDLGDGGNSTPSPGILDLSSLSFLDDNALQIIQGDSLTLAVLDFNGVGIGSSLLSFSYHDLTGLTIAALEHTVTDGSITVSAVPLPGSLWFLGSGLLGLWRIRNTVTSKNPNIS